MRRLPLFASALLAAIVCSAGAANADQECMDRCTANGSPYNLCRERCANDNRGNTSGNGGKTDYACMSQCTQRGYSAQFCQARCN